jgi:hypothetical protein
MGFELRVPGLQSRYSTAWIIPSVHFAWLFWRWGSCELLPGMASNCDPPDLSLPSS